jgi:hypothetical protein
MPGKFAATDLGGGNDLFAHKKILFLQCMIILFINNISQNCPNKMAKAINFLSFWRKNTPIDVMTATSLDNDCQIGLSVEE